MLKLHLDITELLLDITQALPIIHNITILHNITNITNQIFTNITQYYISNTTQYYTGGIQYQYYSILPILPILLIQYYSIFLTLKTVLFQFKMCQYTLILQAISNIPQYSSILPEQLGDVFFDFWTNILKCHIREIQITNILECHMNGISKSQIF